MSKANTIEKQDGFSWGRAYSGFARLRQSNAFLETVILCLFIAMLWNDYNWRNFSERLSEKQWMIVHDKCGDTEVKDVIAFQTGASEVQIRRLAWDMVKWIRAAGSSNIDASYKEATKYMTERMNQETLGTLEQRRTTVKQLNVYFSIDDAKVREIKTEELPLEAQKSGIRASRNDVYVEGVLNTFREGTNEQLSSGPIAYWVHIVPLSRPTMENPIGLLVDSMIALDPKTIKSEKDSLARNNKDNKDNNGEAK